MYDYTSLSLQTLALSDYTILLPFASQNTFSSESEGEKDGVETSQQKDLCRRQTRNEFGRGQDWALKKGRKGGGKEAEDRSVSELPQVPGVRLGLSEPSPSIWQDAFAGTARPTGNRWINCGAGVFWGQDFAKG